MALAAKFSSIKCSVFTRRLCWEILFISIALFGLLSTQAVAEADLSGKGTKLFRAARQGRIPDLQAALNDGADVNTRNDYGETALMSAASM